MTAVLHKGKEILPYPWPQDVADERYYFFNWRPQVRVNSTEYFLDDIIIPSASPGIGYYWICINPGVSASVAPTFTQQLNSVTQDGTVKWKAVAYGHLLRDGDTIASPDVSPASVWTGTSGIVVSDSIENAGITRCKVKITDSSITTFTLSNKVQIHRQDGRYEIFERSIEVQVIPL